VGDGAREVAAPNALCIYLAPYGEISGRISSAARNSTFLPWGPRRSVGIALRSAPAQSGD
jgi:hypothetical protein